MSPGISQQVRIVWGGGNLLIPRPLEQYKIIRNNQYTMFLGVQLKITHTQDRIAESSTVTLYKF